MFAIPAFPRSLCRSTILLVGLVMCPPLLATAEQPPNILFLFTDDQRADTIGALGNSLIQTPHIDQIYRSGTHFSQAYCMGSIHGAVCVPSRAMLLSGKSIYRTNMQLEGQKTFPELFRENGYTTFGTGKWHNGKESFARGFDAGKTILFGGMSDHSRVPIHHMNPDNTFSEKSTGENFSSTIFADAAIDFLATHEANKPFLCYVSFSAPHDPRMPPAPFDEMYAERRPPLPENFLPQHPFNTGQMKIRDEVLAGWPRTEAVVRDQLAEYYGMISHMDQQIGRILKTLSERGMAENTIIVFASDHGLALGSHGLLGKQSLYEHSMRTPVCLAGPGIPADQSSDEFVYLFDLFPTICDYADIPVPEEVEGLSLKPVIEGTETNIRDTVFLTYAGLIRSVRDERWKLVRWPKVNRTQFFDLENDPHEIHDLSESAEHAPGMRRMIMQLADWQKRLGDEQPLVVTKTIPAQIDLSDVKRKPDQWQPQSVVEKYFDKEASDQKAADKAAARDR